MIPLGKPSERILGIGALVLLAIGCVLVLRPFVSALLWAAVICFSTWPAFTRCERVLGGRRSLAAVVMTLLVTVALVAPFAAMVAILAENIASLVAAAAGTLAQGPPAPPPWVATLPLVGETLAAYWESLAHNAPAFLIELKKLIGPAADIAVAGGTAAAIGLLDMAMTVFIAFLFYRHGWQMAAYVRQVTERFAGPRGRRLLKVIGVTVTGVVYGLIGTALPQAGLAAIGFWIAGVPQALLLGVLTFVLSFVPIGPPLVWGSVAIWLVVKGALWWGLFVALWGLLLVSSVDNVVRPYLLGRTSNLPIVLGFFGLIGGIIAFGFIGLFLGPALLAVGYSLFLEWHAAEGEEYMHPSTPPSVPT